MSDRRNIYKALGLLLVPLLGIVLYMPGIGGVFLFDDYPNLSGLASIEGSIFSADFWMFVFSASGLPGRPLSLFTFALQAECWPQDAACFQVVNVFIHAFNGTLVALLGWQVFKKAHFSNAVIWGIALGVIWVTAPVHVSTVLYSVQRMNLLAGSFVLIGLNLVLAVASNPAFLKSPKNPGFYIFFFLFYSVLVLGVLAKENAILLSLFSLLVFVTFIKKNTLEKNGAIYWPYVFSIALPFICLIAYLTYSFDQKIITEYSRREFTMPERLLTELAILFDYIRLVLFPRPEALGLFNDDYPIYGSFFASWKIPAFVLLYLGVAILAFLKKAPLVVFGALFFLFGHVLESTIIPLELYFEHRNYIPSIGLYIAALSIILAVLTAIRSKLIKYTVLGGIAIYLVIWCSILYKEVELWSSPVAQAQTWYEEHPSSLRALGHYASILKNLAGSQYAKELAVDFYEKNGNPTALIFAQYYDCEESLSEAQYEKMASGLREVEFNYGILVTIQGVISEKFRDECSGVSYERILEWLNALESNDNFAPRRVYTSILKNRVQIAQGDFRESIQILLQESLTNNRLDLLVGAAQSAVLAREYELAQTLMDRIDERCEFLSKACFSNSESINDVKERLREYGAGD